MSLCLCDALKGLFQKPVTQPENEPAAKFVPPLSGDSPVVFNQQGERMLWVYLDDELCRHHPYTLTDGCFPRRILWDRYNQGLPVHLYSHRSIFRHPYDERFKQFGLLIEAEVICPDDYEMLLKDEERVKSLSALFTYSERFLDKYENARFSLCNGYWYGTERWGGVLDVNNYKKKSKLLSIAASDKSMVPLHIFRAETARELKRRGLADAMGRAVGEYFEKISDAFDDYMYNVAIENQSTKYYFTEKILNCFASMTIPVYYGATEIGKFFNPDGIIFIEEPTIECVLKTIKQCSREDYESRLEAMKDNFNRVLKYKSVDDYLTDNYWNLFTE